MDDEDGIRDRQVYSVDAGGRRWMNLDTTSMSKTVMSFEVLAGRSDDQLLATSITSFQR